MHSCACLLSHPSPITRARARRSMPTNATVGGTSSYAYDALDPNATPTDINPDSHIEHFADGSMRMPSGMILDTTGKQVGCSPGWNMVNTGVGFFCVGPGGQQTPDGTTINPDGSVTFIDGSNLSSDGLHFTATNGVILDKQADGTWKVRPETPTGTERISKNVLWAAGLILAAVVLGKVV